MNIHHGEDDVESTKYCVVVKLDGDTPRQRTLYVDTEIYEQAKICNKVIKTPETKPTIQLNS